MEIKAILNKPYTEEEYANFIVEQSHNNGYDIKETEKEIQAWGYTEEEISQQKQNKINNFTMTALDFIGVLHDFGLSLEEINAYLENNLEIKMQLTYCQNVYCGVVKQFLPVVIGDIEITSEMAERAFKLKNGEDVTLLDEIADNLEESENL